MKANNIKVYFLTAIILLFSSELLASAESDFKAGVEAFKAGNNAAAAQYFESAQKQGMDSVSLQYNLASSYYKLGRYEEAKKYFHQVNKTVEMRDLAEYNLGLIAIKEKDGTLARKYFNSVATMGKDTKLIKLSKKQLMALSKKEDRWKSYIASHLGYDDNISSVSGDSVLDIADTFVDLFATVDLLLSGRRSDGWVANAYVFGINYVDTDSNDENQFTLGIKRAVLLADWDTSAHLSYTKSNYGKEDFQRITKLDLKGLKPITKRDRLYLRYQLEDIKSDNAIYDYLAGWRQRGRVEYRHFAKNNSTRLYYELELNNRGELVTPSYTYEYSPTRHTVRGVYTYITKNKWWLTGNLAYKYSDYNADTIDRVDNQWIIGLNADYYFNRSFKFTTRYQYIDNNSTIAQYIYDKSIIKAGVSILF